MYKANFCSISCNNSPMFQQHSSTKICHLSLIVLWGIVIGCWLFPPDLRIQKSFILHNSSYLQRSCSVRVIGHCLIFFLEMAWNFEDLHDNFILKCIENCYHCYGKSGKIWKVFGTVQGPAKTLYLKWKTFQGQQKHCICKWKTFQGPAKSLYL